MEREQAFEARQTDVLARGNTRLTEEIARLTTELHATICSDRIR